MQTSPFRRTRDKEGPWESPWDCERTQQGVGTILFLHQGRNANESLSAYPNLIPLPKFM